MADKLTIDSLKKLRDDLRSRTRIEDLGKKIKITVHMGTCGLASGAQEIYDAVLAQIKEKNLTDIAVTTGEELEADRDDSDMILTTSGCAGMCCNEPMMTIKIANHPAVMYQKLTPAKVAKIVEEHVIGGNVVKAYALAMGPEAAY